MENLTEALRKHPEDYTVSASSQTHHQEYDGHRIINSSPNDKRERLVATEIIGETDHRNDDYIISTPTLKLLSETTGGDY